MKDFTKFTVELEDGETFDVDLEEETKIAGKDINTQIEEQPGTYAWYSQVAEDISAEYEQANAELKRMEAVLSINYKKAGHVDGVKVTDTYIKNLVTAHPDRIELENEVLSKKHMKLKMVRALESLVQKKDLMSTLSANIRKNFENEV
jgi:hypothetical protein